MGLRLELAFARRVLALPPPILRALVGPARTSPDGKRLDAQTQGLLALSRLTRQPDVSALGVEGGRRYIDAIGASFDALVPEVTARDTSVSGAEGPRPARVYTPPGTRGVLPGLVFFHGGGFVVGSLDSHDRCCRALARKAGVVVVSVDYRLAPEHKFPAAAQDAVAATRCVLANASSLGIDAAAVAVGGDSAGGTLAAVVAQALRGEDRQPAFQLLIYPVTDVRGGTASREWFREGYFLTARSIDWYVANYIPDVTQHTDPRASPLLARDLSRLPPALVITAGFDPLRDEGKAYADEMRAAGVAVEYLCSDGSIHGFFNASGLFRESARVVDATAARLRAALASRAVASAA
jgi:acetyl esterase